jgi:hypothetical protein
LVCALLAATTSAATARDLCTRANLPQVVTILGGEALERLPIAPTKDATGRSAGCAFTGPGQLLTVMRVELRFLRNVEAALTDQEIARRMQVERVSTSSETPKVVDRLIWARAADGSVSITAAFSFRVVTLTLRPEKKQPIEDAQRQAMRELAEKLVLRR